jgi:hypothetical protein
VSGTRPSGGKQVVVSVRFDSDTFRRTQAFASVVDSTPNAVIRAAVDEYITRHIQTAEFQAASQNHIKRAHSEVEVLLEDHPALPNSGPQEALETDDLYNQPAALGR